MQNPNGPGFFFPGLNVGQGGFGTTSFVFIDPDVATGYNYSVTGGPLFSEVTIPSTLPNGDKSFNLELPGFSKYTLTAGTPFNLLSINPNGFSAFKIDGIDESEALDPTNPTAFVTGLKFTTSGQVNITQIPIVTNVVPPTAVPEPLTILGGLTALGLGAKLKKSLKS